MLYNTLSCNTVILLFIFHNKFLFLDERNHSHFVYIEYVNIELSKCIRTYIWMFSKSDFIFLCSDGEAGRLLKYKLILQKKEFPIKSATTHTELIDILLISEVYNLKK